MLNAPPAGAWNHDKQYCRPKLNARLMSGCYRDITVTTRLFNGLKKDLQLRNLMSNLFFYSQKIYCYGKTFG